MRARESGGPAEHQVPRELWESFRETIGSAQRLSMLRSRRAIAMTDEFPIQKSDVDFQIQELISQDLENARG